MKYAVILILDVERSLLKLSRLVGSYIMLVYADDILPTLFNNFLWNIITKCAVEHMKPPSSFLQAMEEYVKDAPQGSIARKNQV